MKVLNYIIFIVALVNIVMVVLIGVMAKDWAMSFYGLGWVACAVKVFPRLFAKKKKTGIGYKVFIQLELNLAGIVADPNICRLIKTKHFNFISDHVFKGCRKSTTADLLELNGYGTTSALELYRAYQLGVLDTYIIID